MIMKVVMEMKVIADKQHIGSVSLHARAALSKAFFSFLYVHNLQEG